jgi:biotin carboxylase
MSFVVYATPFFGEAAVRNIIALGNLPDVRLGVISQEPQETLGPDVRRHIVAHWRIDDTLDSEQLIRAARALVERHGPIQRLFSATEQLQVPLAEARAELGIDGMSVDVAWNFRDKDRMKSILRAAGLPCARHRLVSNLAGARAFAAEVGYPLVVKPPTGAATQETFRIDGPEALDWTLTASAPSPNAPALLEEFVTGDEHSFDSVSIDGQVVWHSVTQYFPTPLDVLRNPWIQWCVLLPREVDDPQFDDIRAAAARALAELGMRTGMSHLEWFRRPDGTIAISEVAARPPGAQITTLMSQANDFDAIDAWARLMVFDTFDPPVRRYAAGAAYLRAQGQGEHIVGIHGLDAAWHEIGDLVVEARLPHIGQKASTHYEGDGFVILRHEDTAVVKHALFRLISLARVERG